MPWMQVHGNLGWVRCNPIEGQPEPIVALIYDSADTRVVSYWGLAAFRQLAENMLAFAKQDPYGLSIADEEDLRRLKDAGPFLEGPNR